MVAAAAGQGFGKSRLWIETFAVLVQRRHLDIGAEPDRAGVGRVGTRQEIDQRGLAGAVRPDNTDAVAALHADEKTVDDLAVAIGFADALGLDHQPAGFFGFGGREVGVPSGAAIVAALVAQRMQIAEPLDVALAAAGDAVAQPVFLVDDLAIELVLVAFF